MSTVLLQQGINGVVLGSLYVLVALGLTLIYGVLVQINFAHADVVTIGAFAAYFFTFTFGGNISRQHCCRPASRCYPWVARECGNLCTVARTWK